MKDFVLHLNEVLNQANEVESRKQADAIGSVFMLDESAKVQAEAAVFLAISDVYLVLERGLANEETEELARSGMDMWVGTIKTIREVFRMTDGEDIVRNIREGQEVYLKELTRISDNYQDLQKKPPRIRNPKIRGKLDKLSENSSSLIEWIDSWKWELNSVFDRVLHLTEM